MHENIKKYMDEIVVKLNKEINKCIEIEKGFMKKLDHTSPSFRRDLKDKSPDGKYSYENLDKAMNRKLILENELDELRNFSFYFFKDKL